MTRLARIVGFLTISFTSVVVIEAAVVPAVSYWRFEPDPVVEPVSFSMMQLSPIASDRARNSVAGGGDLALENGASLVPGNSPSARVPGTGESNQGSVFFSASESVAIGAIDNSLASLKDFTMEFYFKPQSSAGTLLEMGTRSGGSMTITYELGTGLQIDFSVSKNASGNKPGKVDDFSLVNGGNILADEWNFMALTYDSSSGTASLFVNGVETSTVSDKKNRDIRLGTTGDPLTLGGFTGWMDEVRISSAPLMESELIAVGIPEPQTTAVWTGLAVAGLVVWRRRRAKKL